jgi:hypothetical protein
MINPNFLVSVDKDVEMYPNKSGSIVTMLGTNNSKYESIVLKSEANLALYLQNLSSFISNSQISRLKALIEDFALDKYSEGSDDASMYQPY